MASHRLRFAVLCLWLQITASETNIIGLLGDDVELRCHYAGKETFPLNNIRVQWQKKDDFCLVDGYLPDKDAKKYQCKEFTNRTQLLGNFSLKLLHVSVKDEHTYECIVQKYNTKTNMFEYNHSASTSLKVAAKYSIPTITRLQQSEDEMTFTCNSSYGYPKQKLCWTTNMDNFSLNETEWSSVLESDGTYSVSSTVVIKTAYNINLSCTIENERLNQSITIFETGSLTKDFTSRDRPHNRPTILSIPLVILILMLSVILYIWWKKRRSPQRTYTAGVYEEEAVHANAAVQTENFQCS